MIVNVINCCFFVKCYIYMVVYWQHIVSCECHINYLLCKVGNMFDTIQRNNGLTQDWSILLIQLVSSGVVDIQNNRYRTYRHRVENFVANPARLV